jgi:hypothetical protein
MEKKIADPLLRVRDTETAGHERIHGSDLCGELLQLS